MNLKTVTFSNLTDLRITRQFEFSKYIRVENVFLTSTRTFIRSSATFLAGLTLFLFSQFLFKEGKKTYIYISHLVINILQEHNILAVSTRHRHFFANKKKKHQGLCNITAKEHDIVNPKAIIHWEHDIVTADFSSPKINNKTIPTF